jgi:hypothetical protein
MKQSARSCDDGHDEDRHRRNQGGAARLSFAAGTSMMAAIGTKLQDN